MTFTATRNCLLAIISLLAFFTANANDSDQVNCNRTWKIVVLGSSTAYGTGASTYDSSWVGKFTAYVKRKNSANEVYNLGIPGFTTYQNLCPTGFVPPANRPTPNAAFNISAALALQPDAIVINMPSNDASNGYSLEEQQANFERTLSLADAANVPVWVTTTQPRNNMSNDQINNLIAMRNWINGRLGDKAVDFWSTVANPDGSINSTYGYDYVHVNNLGHELFYSRIKAESILDTLCIRVTPTLVARAGNDQSLTLPVANVELNGSASYVSNGGFITGYQWTQVSGPTNVTLNNANAAIAQAVDIAEGRYQFALTVTDNSNTQRSDTLLVVVSSRILIDFGPDASGTPDANGRYWNNIADGRPGIKLSNAISTGNAATTIGLEIINRIDGTFNVNGPGTNTGNSTGDVQDYPASATADFAFAEPSASNGQWKITGLESTKQYTIKFWGTRSVSDNRIIQIKRADQSIWQEYNAAGNSNYENAATFTFYGKSQITFDIRVKNGSAFGYISLIDIVKTTPAQTTNIAPVAQASDVNLAIPATSATLNGSASYDDDGSITGYQWTQTSGPNTAEIVTPNAAITTINNLEEGIYTFRLQVTDDSSAVAGTTITVTVNRRVLIDFGATLTNGADASGKFWNNVADGLPGVKIEDAVTTGNTSSGIAFEIINRIDGTFNPAGPGVNTGLIGTDVGDYPNSAVADYVFAHNSATNGQWKLSGLDSSKQYVIKFWGTRDASDERTILIKPSDATVWQQYDARNNSDYNNAAVFTFVGKTERTFDIKVSDNSTFGHISLVDIRITNPPVDCKPTIEIVVDKKEAVCAGTAVTFTATATHLGTQPVYEWRRNGVAVANVSGNVYTANDFNNNDIVSCKITSNTLCVYGDTAVSNDIAVAVLAPVALGSISGPTDACPLIGGSAIYTVPADASVNVYNWTAPAGTSIISGQGTNSIELGFNNGFGTSAILTVVGGSCSNPVPSVLNIVKNIPAETGAITGPNNACGYVGTSNLATYSIAPVANATTYLWSVPAGAQISSGQGSTSIQVQFSTAYVSGAITVAASSNCYTSTASRINVGFKSIAELGIISGPADACPLIGSTATYSIPASTDVVAYAWTVPAGTSIVSGQGTNSIVLSFNSTFGTSGILSVQDGVCPNATATTLNIVKNTPATPGAITGPASACGYVGTATQVTYSVTAVPFATSYNWSVPAAVQIVSGQGTNSIKVVFGSTYTAASISVAAVSNCATSTTSSIAVAYTRTATPGVISGPTDACGLAGTTTQATYTIRKVANATSYNWTVPTGVTVSSHPAGLGVNDTIIRVTFSSTYANGGIISVQAIGCTTSDKSNLTITRQLPAAPAPIRIISNPCNNLLNTRGTFQISKLAGLTYLWTGPSGSSLISSVHTDSTITFTIQFPYFMSSGTIGVAASNGCGTGAYTYLPVQVVNASSINLNLSGPSDVCAFIGTNTVATYKVNKAFGANSYNWTVPTTGVTVTHPAGLGVNDTIITVAYNSAFTSGSISVSASTGCGNSSTKTIYLTKTAPAAPASGITLKSTTTCPNRTHVYSVTAIPANASRVFWTVPTGAVIVSGQGTTSITVAYPSTSIAGYVKAYGQNNCSTSAGYSFYYIQLGACTQINKGTSSEEPVVKTAAQTSMLAMPNPSTSDFRILISSNDLQTKGTLRIIDITGAVKEIRNNVSIGQTITLGNAYKAGVYIAEFIHGTEKVVTKLIKL